MRPATPSPDTTLTALRTAWRSHQQLLAALLLAQSRLGTHCLKEDRYQPEHCRRLLLRLIADQAAFGYDSVALQQEYDAAYRHWAQACGLPLPELLWQWHSAQQQRRQRILLTLTRATLQQCQLRLASERQAA